MLIAATLRSVMHVVRLRRRLRGPMRPSWDDRFETWATVLHHYAKRSLVLPLSAQRRAAAGVMAPRGGPDVRYERVVAGGVKSEWFVPASCDESRVLMYLHGGGYCLGSIDSHRDPVGRLCSFAKVRGFVIDYRLAPEHPFPAQLDDALAAYRWLLDQGIAPSRIVVAGESAGGGLALSLLIALRDSATPLPAAAVCVSPWVDLEVTGQSMQDNARFDYVSRRILLQYARYFVPNGETRNPLAAPIHADLRGLPPLLVLAGEAETLLDDATRIAARAREHGVDVTLEIEPDMIHAWPLFASSFACARHTLERMAAFIGSHLGETSIAAVAAASVTRA
jgi:monoterpene epsilon-lactone hydrolase